MPFQKAFKDKNGSISKSRLPDGADLIVGHINYALWHPVLSECLNEGVGASIGYQDGLWQEISGFVCWMLLYCILFLVAIPALPELRVIWFLEALSQESQM